jgi:hypothetical protein
VALNSGKLVLGWQDSKSRAMLLRRGFFMMVDANILVRPWSAQQSMSIGYFERRE